MNKPVWTTACRDWEKRIVARQSLIAFPPLFPEMADEGLDVFSELRIVDMMGSPTIGEVSKPWIFDLPRHLFGSLDPETGRRLISEYFLLVSKKNFKSGLAAATMLSVLIKNWRESAEFLILSPTVEIANNSYRPMRDMIGADPLLAAMFQVQNHIRTITHRTTGATLQVVAAESETVGGKKATGVFVDELWLFGKRPNAENMLREACGGLASRPEGFVIYATTQSDEPPAGVFRQKLQYARGVRDGRIDDPSFLPILYEFPEKMVKEKLTRLPENFYITNPNLGASVDEAFLLREMKKAEETGEESMLGVLSKHLNVEIGLALRNDRWPGADFWQGCADPVVTLDYLLENCEVVDVGIDGGGLDDLLGLYVIGRHAVTRKWVGWAHAWAHKSVLERRKLEAPRLMDFKRDGDLTIVEIMGEDVVGVAKICARIEEAGILDKIGVDPHAIGAILAAITSDPLGDEGEEEQIYPDYGYCAGIPGSKVIGISQGWKLVGAIKTAERKIAEGAFVHGGQPLMAWCVGNARKEPRGNAELITKQASGSAKIDPLMAMFNAVTLMALNPAAGTSIYERRGIVAI